VTKQTEVVLGEAFAALLPPGRRHPDRDAPFRYSNGQVKEFTAAGQPVLSVDTKKKDVLGEDAVAGQEWHRAGQPIRVRAHDFPDKSAQKAVPYGTDDLAADAGWVSVGGDGTPPRSRSRPCAAGGTVRAGTAIRRRPDCCSPPTRVAPTATGCGPGRRSWPASPTPAGSR
jgi:hypothetical protein